MRREVLHLCKLFGVGDERKMCEVPGYKITEYLGVCNSLAMGKVAMPFNGEGWHAQHIPTGASLGLPPFVFLKDAKEFIKRISKVTAVPWEASRVEDFVYRSNHLLTYLTEVGEGRLDPEECSRLLLVEILSQN